MGSVIVITRLGHQNTRLRHCISPGDYKISCWGKIRGHYRTSCLLKTCEFDIIPTYFTLKWPPYFECVSLKHPCMINDRYKYRAPVIFICKLSNLPDNGHVVLKPVGAIANTTIISKPVVCWVGRLLNCNHVISIHAD